MRVPGSSVVFTRLRAVAGVVCLILAAGLAFFWFWILAPTRHLSDYDGWLVRHSRLAQWEEVQREVHRFAWTHESSGDVGPFGGKDWVEWILRRARPGGTFDLNGGDGQEERVLSLITNQELGSSPDAWLSWWSVNRDRSQAEWIADGFRKQGIDVSPGLTPGVTRQMLLILGNTNVLAGAGAHVGVHFNAFRWLRDHQFDAMSFALADLHDPQGEALLRGLLKYQRLLPVYPSLEPPRVPKAYITNVWVALGFYASIVATALAGGWLLGFIPCRIPLGRILKVPGRPAQTP